MHRWSFHKDARTVSYLPGLFVCAAARIHEQCASCGNMFYPALTCLLDGGARAHRRCTAQQCMLAQQRHFFSATRTCDPLSPRTPSEFSTSLSADLRGVMHPVRMNSATRGRFWLRNAYLSFPTCRANPNSLQSCRALQMQPQNISDSADAHLFRNFSNKLRNPPPPPFATITTTHFSCSKQSRHTTAYTTHSILSLQTNHRTSLRFIYFITTRPVTLHTPIFGRGVSNHLFQIK
ncbi:hypothetical protein BON22_3040 [Cyberlindnera fabianii]|uniref:Uncharacterized protein n=1 Tax=Cyberlindnera fabianii TaxID=36022 RepID=A0A1V2L5T1_CYBFA|nr:hypothetical protein BON22_3040 [Cyberlindnera fabianii]